MITVSVSNVCQTHNGDNCLWHGSVNPTHFLGPKAYKSWLYLPCSRAIHDREVAHKRYLSLPSPDSHAQYISAANNAKSVLQPAKNSFINMQGQNLSSSSSSRDFWHPGKNISPLLHPDCIPAVSSVSKAELFVQTLADNTA